MTTRCSFRAAAKVDVKRPVLAGGNRVLGLASTIICEVAAHNSAAVRDLLTAHGYVLCDGDRPAGERVPVTDAPPNTLAVSRFARPPAARGGGRRATSGNLR
jgi:hypothetical protein